MDPVATLKALLEAIKDGDRFQTAEYATALLNWLETGGFMPNYDDVVADVIDTFVEAKREQGFRLLRIVEVGDAGAATATEIQPGRLHPPVITPLTIASVSKPTRGLPFERAKRPPGANVIPHNPCPGKTTTSSTDFQD